MKLSSGRPAIRMMLLLLMACVMAGCMPSQMRVAQEMLCEQFTAWSWGELAFTSTPQVVDIDTAASVVQLLGWALDDAQTRQPVWLTLDVPTGQTRPWSPAQIPTSYRDVCINCDTAVFSASPQQTWQLVQTTGQKYGVWLVSRKQSIPILPYIPRYDEWAWMEDGSTLLYIYSLPRTGTSFAIIHLDEAFPRLVYFEDLIHAENSLAGDSSYIDPFHHTLAFDAQTGLIWATRRGFPTAGKIYQYDVRAKRLTTSWEASSVLKTSWHPALHSIMQMRYDTAGLHLEATNGRVRAHVPRRTLEQLYKKPADKIYTHHLADLSLIPLPHSDHLLLLDGARFFTAVCHSDYDE